MKRKLFWLPFGAVCLVVFAFLAFEAGVFDALFPKSSASNLRAFRSVFIQKNHPPEIVFTNSLFVVEGVVLKTIADFGGEAVVKNRVSQKQKKGAEEFDFQTFYFSSNLKEAEFKEALLAGLRQVEVSSFRLEKNELRLFVSQVPTHLLVFEQPQTQEASEEIAEKKEEPKHIAPPKKKKAKKHLVDKSQKIHAKTPLLAIVIDDLGEQVSVLDTLAKLEYPVTFSILPFTPFVKETVATARKKRFEIMLHLPCEPIGYPHRAKPGKGALFVNMPDKKMRRVLRQDIAAVAGISGVNNHMGSFFTQDLASMRIVLRELKKRKLFFLDSLTTANGRVRQAAKQMGMPYIRRNLFLDNEFNTDKTLLQLKKAENIAKKKGSCIVIGHPHPTTLAALKTWEKKRDKSVRIVSISQILQRKKKGKK